MSPFSTLPTVARVGVILVIGYAAYRDATTRRVSNEVWIVGGGLAAVAAVAGVPTFSTVAYTVLGVVIAFLLWHVGTIGGADSKAVMVIVIAFPVQTQIGAGTITGRWTPR